MAETILPPDTVVKKTLATRIGEEFKLHKDLLDTKITANAPIAPSTGTKVTYDSNGLVVSSAPLTQDDIPTLDASKITGTVTLNVDGNSATATKLSTPKTIALTGDAVGEVLFDGSTAVVIDVTADLTDVKGHILPSEHRTQDIGSPTRRFRKIYVDEAMLSINTLYIGDTPILGTSADTIMIKADPDQSIQMRTSGVGSTQIQSGSEVLISTAGMNADVKVQATGTNSKVRLGGAGGVEINSATSMQDNLAVSGNVTIGGALILNGATFEVNATTVTTKDNIIVINKGEVGEGVTAGKAGIQVDRGDAPDFQFIFDETVDKFVVGMVGGTMEVVATREWTTLITDTKVDKIAGKGLSANDFTTDYKNLIDLLNTKVAVLNTSTVMVILN